MSLVVKCPQCKTEVIWDNSPRRPFCSERCQLMDLGGWADEKYRIPGGVLEDESDPDNDDSDENLD